MAHPPTTASAASARVPSRQSDRGSRRNRGQPFRLYQSRVTRRHGASLRWGGEYPLDSPVWHFRLGYPARRGRRRSRAPLHHRLHPGALSMALRMPGATTPLSPISSGGAGNLLLTPVSFFASQDRLATRRVGLPTKKKTSRHCETLHATSKKFPAPTEEAAGAAPRSTAGEKIMRYCGSLGAKSDSALCLRTVSPG